MVTQTNEAIPTTGATTGTCGWTCQRRLPNSAASMMAGREGAGALETLLLDKHNYQQWRAGDGAVWVAGEKGAIHLFTSGPSPALMQPRA